MTIHSRRGHQRFQWLSVVALRS